MQLLTAQELQALENVELLRPRNLLTFAANMNPVSLCELYGSLYGKPGNKFGARACPNIEESPPSGIRSNVQRCEWPRYSTGSAYIGVG